MKKLNIGCGDHPLPGWINADMARLDESIVFLDARQRFPFEDKSIDRIFSEHMIEHITWHQGLDMLRECHRVLVPGGRIRISTPDWDFLIRLLTSPYDLINCRYLAWAVREFRLCSPDVKDPAMLAPLVVNNFVRAWGHQFIYSRGSMIRSGLTVGFSNQFYWSSIQESNDPEFRGLENDTRMPAGFLQMETMTIEMEKHQ